MIKQTLSVVLIGIFGLFTVASSTSAHILVSPKEAGVATYQTVTIGVTNDKDNPTTTVQMRIPTTVTEVIPNIKSGWDVTLKETEDADGNPMKEIAWTGGEIPAGKRDEFRFEAKLPDQETVLTWKVYQTYEDGTIISWDQDPTLPLSQEEQAKKNLGAYAETKVTSDSQNVTADNPLTSVTQTSDNRVLFLSIAAITLSGISITMQLMRRK